MKKYRSTEYALTNSGWILLESAELMFKTTKERIFNDKGEFEPELPPKWQALTEILRVEIPGDLKRDSKQQDNPKLLKDPVKVLILCYDSRTCYQLNQYLTQGGDRYLFHMAIRNEIPINKISEKIKKNCAAFATNVEQKDGGAANNKTRKPTPKPAANTSTSTRGSKTGNRFLKDRIKEKEDEALKAAEKEQAELLDLKDEDNDDDDDQFRESYLLTMTQKLENGDFDGNEDDEMNSTLLSHGTFESYTQTENLDFTSMITSVAAPLICIQTFKSGSNGFASLEQTLADIDPKYIIMFHSNVTAIRQIEIFEARKNRPPDQRVKVFFLLHTQTVEEQSYLTGLRREKQAFELLIDTMRRMVVPEYQDGKSDDWILRFHQPQIVDEDENTVSRQAGGQSTDNQKIIVQPKIIVDIREFRSELPCLIHKRGIEIVPVMIGIGDYILTPDICVERKSLSDLIGSLNSGRLYNQCIQMTRFYAKPILLIEFDQNKPFHLQGRYIIGGDVTSNIDITHKLQLLTLHFPKVKIVWSPSPYATAKLFEELKMGKPEPDPDQAAAIGTDLGADMENVIDSFNTNIYDFLIKLPGVNVNNIGKLMRSVKNFKELIEKSQDELKELLSGEINAKLFWDILHVAHKPIENNSSEKLFVGRKMGKRKLT